jgi:transposase-like protein
LFKRHGIGYLPELDEKKKEKKKFKEEGKQYLFDAIDRTSKFVYVELLEKQGKMETAQFLRNLFAVVPYKIHTILTDKGQQFTNLPHQKYAKDL